MGAASKHPEMAWQSHNGLRAHIVESEDELFGLRERWDELHSRSRRPTIFTTWEWSASAWRHLSGGSRMFVVVVEDGRELVGVAPLVVDTGWRIRVGRFMGAGSLTYSVSDYSDFIVCPGLEREIPALILRALLSRCDAWDVLDLHQVPAQSPLLASWLDEVDRYGFPFLVDAQSTSYPIELSGTRREYMARLSRNTKETIERKRRKLQNEHNLRFERVNDQSELEKALDRLFALHTERWNSRGSGGIFRSQQLRDFHRELASLFLDRGWLDLTTMFAGDIPVGAIYNFEYGGTASYYCSGFRCSTEWARYSPGTLLLGHSIDRGIEKGLARFDLLRGDGEYKSKFDPTPATNYRVRIAQTEMALRLHEGAAKLGRAVSFPWRYLVEKRGN